MDDKFRSILNLALHPNTNEGEASAALNRARAMVQKTGFDALVGAAPTPVPSVKTVVEERIVYRYRPRFNSSRKITIRIPAEYQCAMLERIFVDAPSWYCDAHMTKCTGVDNQIGRGMILEFILNGERYDLDQFEDAIDSYVTQMRLKSSIAQKQRYRPFLKRMVDRVRKSAKQVLEYMGL